MKYIFILATGCFALLSSCNRQEYPKRIWRYVWNEAGMLVKVIRPLGSEVTFKYDALGRRIEKRFKQTITKWLWDGNKVLHEQKLFDARESTPDDLITWVFSQEQYTPVAKIKGEKRYSLVADHLGTPTQGYNEEGDLIWNRELDSYGKTRMLKGDEGFCNFRFQGQYYDSEIDLCYSRFRYYCPNSGTFISQDPIGLMGSNPNIYAYVEDPNTQIDPFGLYLHRPYIRKSTRIGVEGNADIVNGRFVDANNPDKLIAGGKSRSYSIAEGEYHLGHIYGREYHTEKALAKAEGLTQKQFNDRMNNPALYQIEDPLENMSHKHEKKKAKTSSGCK